MEIIMNQHENELKIYMDKISNEITNFIQTQDIAALQQAKNLILASEKQGGRVHVTGIGKPGHVAGYVASLLSSTGTPAYFLHGTEAIHGSAGQVLSGDVVIAISNSGETSELKSTIMTVKKNGAKIISVAGNPDSWLAKKGDAFLFAGVSEEGDSFGKPPRASILAEIIVLQSLSVLLQYEKNLNAEMYVQWHPGGSLGDAVRSELK